MYKSEQINELAKALAIAQKSFGHITKSKTAKAGAYSYNYADLSIIMEAIRIPLAENELIVVQDVSQEVSSAPRETQDYLDSYLLHSSGQFIKTVMPIIATEKAGPQGYASSLTYARRYGICNLLGLVADDDEDGQIAQAQSEKTPPKGKDVGKTVNKNATKPSEAQLKRLFAIAHNSNWREPDLRAYLKQMGMESTKELSYFQYEKMCENMQKFPKSVAEATQ